MPTRRPTIAAALAVLFLGPAGTALPADKPAAPAAAQPQAKPGSLVPTRPDLVVTIEGSGPSFPTRFTVKNIGTADSKPSILKVSAVFVPADVNFNDGSFGSFDPKKVCGEPFGEVVEIVPALKPGDSHTIAREVGPSSLLVKSVFKKASSTQVTHLSDCVPALVCAFDVVAKADASNDNEELNEANNTATRRAFREIRFQ